MSMNAPDDAVRATAKDVGTRERSTIEFPYAALQDAMELAKGIHDTTGSQPIQHDQLAAAVSMSPNSSGYRMRISAARLFGLLESAGGAAGVRLTDLGQTIVDSAREREAKAKAFLNVPLFGKLYESYRGKVLPPAAALEREMAGLGVAQKQTERARQVFQRSAEVAGFFEMDRSRLIMPAGLSAEAVPPEEKKEQKSEPSKSGGGGGSRSAELDPIIEGLLARVPKAGAVWPTTKRKAWLDLLGSSFALIYKETTNEDDDGREGLEDVLK
jgi:hypothetical protein